MRIESLEDRRLLALSPISVPEAAALRDTAVAIGGFSARLEDFGALAKKSMSRLTAGFEDSGF